MFQNFHHNSPPFFGAVTASASCRATAQRQASGAEATKAAKGSCRGPEISGGDSDLKMVILYIYINI